MTAILFSAELRPLIDNGLFLGVAARREPLGVLMDRLLSERGRLHHTISKFQLVVRRLAARARSFLRWPRGLPSQPAAINKRNPNEREKTIDCTYDKNALEALKFSEGMSTEGAMRGSRKPRGTPSRPTSGPKLWAIYGVACKGGVNEKQCFIITHRMHVYPGLHDGPRPWKRRR